MLRLTSPTGLIRALALTALCTLPLVSARAEPPQEPAHSEEGDHHEEGHGPRNFVGGFVGGTSSGEGSGFTAGFEYEVHLNHRVGLGITAESVGGDLNENVVVGLIYFRPTERLGIFGGGGWERRLSVREAIPEPASDGDEGHESGGREPLGRVGVGYEIPMGRRAAFVPNVSLDFVAGQTIVVYGATIGFRF